MTLEELLKALEATENGAEMVEVVKGLQGEITKKNNEAKNLRTRLRDADAQAAALKERVGKISGHLGLEEDEEDLDGALEALKKSGKGKSDGDVEERIRRMEAKYAKEKQQNDALLAAERAKRHDVLKTQAIVSALAAGKAIKPEQLAGLLAGKVKVGEDDALTFQGEDGAEVSLQNGVTSWLKANPEFVTSSQVPGAGSPPAGGGAGGTQAGSFGKALAAQAAGAPKESPYFKD